MNEEQQQVLRDAAHALSLLPPMLREQYVATLRLYADEPWRMGARCKNCGEPIYDTSLRWRHVNGMYTCTPNAVLPVVKWRERRYRAEPWVPKLDKPTET